jgi:hypothetical protein
VAGLDKLGVAEETEFRPGTADTGDKCFPAISTAWQARTSRGCLASSSEIWSAPSAPRQLAAAYSFGEPVETTEPIPIGSEAAVRVPG